MISKDLRDSYLYTAGKLFASYTPGLEKSMTEEFLSHEQLYRGTSGVYARIQYSWFSILPDESVRENSRLQVPIDCDRLRQNFAGLRAGHLYEDKLSRWLGIDNYHVRAWAKTNRTIIDVENFRFACQVGPRRKLLQPDTIQ